MVDVPMVWCSLRPDGLDMTNMTSERGEGDDIAGRGPEFGVLWKGPGRG